jgi:very-short-patch-repair endonuclease/prophage antirepressor-like protein
MEDNYEIELIEDDNKNELTTYTYISNGLYFEYFVGYEIAALLGYKNTTQVVIINVSKSNQLVFKDYPGIKTPELHHNTILITRDGAIEILLKTRKRIYPDVLHILKKFNIDTTNRKCLTKEQQTLSTITNVFKTEKFEDQFKIGSYYLDLFFTDYKIVIECDENGHADRKPWKERERMDFVNKKLGINDSNWIRFNPDEYDFDISRVIGRIYRKIDEIKQEDYIRLLEEEKTKVKENVEELENWNLEIQVRTGKFLAPPKEDLLKKLKKYRTVSELKRKYNISAKPIEKWLKEYNINVKDYDKMNAPDRDELISVCRSLTSRAEVAKHFDVSVHIFGRWCEKYSIDFYEIRKKEAKVSKEELLKLTTELSNEEISEKLDIPVTKTLQILKANSIEHIPSKEELELLLQTKSKEELALHYNTCRTTLRSWIKLRGLQDIRCKVKTHRSISVTDANNTTRIFNSVKDLCQELKMTPSTIRMYANTNTRYKGYLFTDNSEYVSDDEVEEIKKLPEPEEEIQNIKCDFTIYSDIDNIKYFIGKEIADFIGVKDSNQCIRGLVSDINKIKFEDYQGIKNPVLKHNTILITKEGIKEILLKSRKLKPGVENILEKYCELSI